MVTPSALPLAAERCGQDCGFARSVGPTPLPIFATARSKLNLRPYRLPLISDRISHKVTLRFALQLMTLADLRGAKASRIHRTLAAMHQCHSAHLEIRHVLLIS